MLFKVNHRDMLTLELDHAIAKYKDLVHDGLDTKEIQIAMNKVNQIREVLNDPLEFDIILTYDDLQHLKLLL